MLENSALQNQWNPADYGGRFHIVAMQASDHESWDQFLRLCPMATFLHSRRFLSYHGNRFDDRSVLIIDDKDQLVGVFPAAVDPVDPGSIVSHPGCTYGGILHSGKLRGQDMIDALSTLCGYFEEQGFTKLTYKATPHIYHVAPTSDDLYALFRLGAERHRVDLSSTITLAARGKVSSRRQRGIRKAENSGVQIAQGERFLDEFWVILQENLATRHDAEPVHSYNDMLDLCQRFPKKIHVVVALLDQSVVAGSIIFRTRSVAHAQYIASDDSGRQNGALDLLFDRCISGAASRGAQYFDFGISNEQGGHFLNDGLYQYKSEFGGHGIPYESYRLDLTRRVS